jgi:uncharacterized integral membrane protein (TIGR00697 family)
MANEIIFFGQIFIVVAFVLASLRIGKGALVALIAVEAVLANIFVMKQIDLFGLTVTSSDVFTVGVILGLNLLQERFGKEEAKRALNISFVAMIFLACMSRFQLAYAPSPGEGTHEAFSLIFSSGTRLALASTGVYYVVQKWDIWFFGQLHRFPLTVKLWISLLVSQALDTVLFTWAGLYGIVDSVLDVMIMSYAVKCLVIALSAPLAALSNKLVARETP